jgi:hypothetical protein
MLDGSFSVGICFYVILHSCLDPKLIATSPDTSVWKQNMQRVHLCQSQLKNPIGFRTKKWFFSHLHFLDEAVPKTVILHPSTNIKFFVIVNSKHFRSFEQNKCCLMWSFKKTHLSYIGKLILWVTYYINFDQIMRLSFKPLEINKWMLQLI